jgi:hypothetical protein
LSIETATQDQQGQTGKELDRLTVFAFLWAVATLFHQFSFKSWMGQHESLGWLVTTAAFVLTLRPRSILIWAMMLALSILYTLQRFPFVPNHILFESLVNVTVLLGLAHTMIHRRLIGEPGTKIQFSHGLQSKSARDDLFEGFAPAVRIELLLLYGFTVLHKLNRDFLDPEVSCAGHMLRTLAVRLPSLPTAQWASLLSIWITLIIEACIPLFLCFRRSRNLGILLGLGFHSLLGLHRHPGLYSFSAMLFALFFLFTGEDFTADLTQLERAIRHRVREMGCSRLLFRVSATVGLALLLGRGLWMYQGSYFPHSYSKGLITWIVWTLGLIGIYVGIFVIKGRAETRSPTTFGCRWKTIWTMPALLVLNGMSPYLGLKTETSFSMFSNLRTEGSQPNHLFVPNWLKLTALQDDLVEVSASDNRVLQDYTESNSLLPYFEFRRECSRIPGDFWVDYRRNGVRIHFARTNGVSSDPVLVKPQPWLLTKLLVFRPVDPGPRVHCSH